jgi:Putative metal-binding motif
MRVLSGLKRAAVATCRVAVCIGVVAGCSDDDKGKDLPDSGDVFPGSDGGPGTGLDGGLDGSLVGRDATVQTDGEDIEPPPPPDGGDASTPDSGADSAAPLPCNGSCDDNVDCTIDSCVAGTCQHRIDDSVCAAGNSCSLTMGCQQGKACANNMDCADTDGCTVNERCDTMLARCTYAVLDRDGDGYAPISCGGTDCDDAQGLVSPSAPETCDGEDEDCDRMVDEGVELPSGYTCSMGQVTCTEGFSECGGFNGGCKDLKTDPAHCGSCNESCGSGGVCTNGACSCPPGGSAMMCGMAASSCSDTSKSENNCGACGSACMPMGQQDRTCIAGDCTPCGGENQVCCENSGLTVFNNGCAVGLSCDGIVGAAGSKCVCGAGSTKCGDVCVDLQTSEANCGACGTVCGQGETCTADGAAAPACKSCGRVGERCCDVGGFGVCRGGLACGPDDTCVSTGGGPAGGPSAPGRAGSNAPPG